MFTRRTVLGACASALAAAASPSFAQETVKIGLILPMTGPFASTGRQIDAAVKLYMAEHGASVAGKTVEVIVKDDASVADTTKRLARELMTHDGVKVIAGFGTTPLALAAAPLATEAKVPQIVMAAGASIVTERSPFIVRTSFTVAQKASVMAQWAVTDNIVRVFTLVADYAPGHDAEKVFKREFTKSGGEIVGEARVPVVNPDFAPFLQRAADARPNAIFVFMPSGQGAAFTRQFTALGLERSGITLIATGDLPDDDILNNFGDGVLGMISADPYSTAHPSEKNKAYVAAFQKANPGMRPNFMSVGGYDGMNVIYEALRKTGGNTDGEALIAAMKGLTFESPRGPITIDPLTRDIVQNVYLRTVVKAQGKLWNVEFDVIEQVKDPGKAQ